VVVLAGEGVLQRRNASDQEQITFPIVGGDADLFRWLALRAENGSSSEIIESGSEDENGLFEVSFLYKLDCLGV
jgi:hypothetical protein